MRHPESNAYTTGPYTIDLTHGLITRGDIKIKLRPRTLELLSVFLVQPEHLIPKTHFLKEVWNDVTVDEQVVFQSIKEIRKAFPDLEVIKTHPRKGYTWIAPLKSKEENKVGPFSQLPRLSVSNWTVAVISSLALITFLLLPAKNEKKSRDITVLPVHTTFDANTLPWARLGGLDQILNVIEQNSPLDVTPIDQVLSLKPKPFAFHEPEEIQDLFKRFPSKFLVELVLGGLPGEYQLTYKIHQPGSVERGVVFKDLPQEAFASAGEIILNKIQGKVNLDKASERVQLNNAMLAMGIEAITQQDFETAVNYLQAVTEEEPENIIAKRHFAWAELQLGNLDRAVALAEQAIEDMLLESEPDTINIQKQLGRMRYVLAKAKIAQGELDEAFRILNLAYNNTSRSIDLFYHTNINEMLGQLHLNKKDFTNASVRFKQAAEYYQVLQCPYGSAVANLSLASVHSQRGELEKAINYSQKAVAIAQANQIEELELKSAKNLSSYLSLLGETTGNETVRIN